MKILCYDLETMQELFLVGVYNPQLNLYRDFEVSKWKNELDLFVDWTDRKTDHYWVGYNNLRFDAQVIEYIIRNCEHWHDFTNLEITAMIAQKAQDVIHDANYDVFPEYREQDLNFKQIDLFKINHFDNKNRMVSLKRLEFEMDFENIEEMPIHHTKIDMTLEEVILTKSYCKNDVMATYEFYKITIGETEHPLYKGNNQVQLRMDIEEEFHIPCLNYSDSKIGDEMIKKFYCQEKRIDYKKLPKKGFFRKSIKVKNCIAKYVKFQTPELNKFYQGIKERTMKMQDEFLEEIHFYNNNYTFAKGGLHSVNTPKIFEANDEYLIIDWDVSLILWRN